MDPRASHSLDLQGSIGVLLTFLANRLTATGSATFRRRFGLGILDVRLLITLGAKPDVSPGRICDVMGLDGGAVSRALRGLAERDLVASRPDGRNPNYKYWSLTDAGVRLQDELVSVSMARDTALLKDFDDEEQAMLIAMMRRMLVKVEMLRSTSVADESF